METKATSTNSTENRTFAQECIMERIFEKEMADEFFEFYYEGDSYTDEE